MPCRPPSSARVLRQAEEARLSSSSSSPGRSRRACPPPKPCSRSAPSALLHVRPHRLGAVERAGQVDAQVALPSSGCWSWIWPTWSRVTALFTRISAAPRPDDAATVASTCSRSVTSHRRDRPVRAPRSPRPSTPCRPFPSPARLREHAVARPTRPLPARLDRESAIARRPGAGERQRSARPRPREPPVTRATRPERSISIATPRSYAGRRLPASACRRGAARAAAGGRTGWRPPSEPRALAVARSVVALIPPMRYRVPPQIRSRPRASPFDVERDLYEERTLVRILGMRARCSRYPELVPVVYSA